MAGMRGFALIGAGQAAILALFLAMARPPFRNIARSSVVPLWKTLPIDP
jgi:hypothetical protein